MVELVWDGKYDKDGKRVAPLRVSLPFQTVETVNESAQQRQRTLDLFAAGRDAEWRNRLIWGDKKYVLPSLLPEFAGKVDLIYIDPPFATGDDFSFQAKVGDKRFEKEASIIEQKAYRDTWGRGLDGYLAWFHDTVAFLHELLSEKGAIYVHLDYHVSSHAKVILDETFGSANFINEITWKRKGGSANPSNRYGVVTDTLLLYAKSEAFQLKPLKTLISDEVKRYIKERFTNEDDLGKFMIAPVERNAALGVRENLKFEYRNYLPEYGWMMSKEKLIQLDTANRLHWNNNNRPNRKIYLAEYEGHPVNNLWTDIFVINPMAKERLNYPTQKPEALLERIIRASSNEGDLVLDCFCGSGTTAAVAEKENRRWIACDLGRFAIHTTRKRLLGIDNVRPFVVQNLGKYERQVWQKAEFGEEVAYQMRSYRKFILDLYHAEMVEGYTWLHGRKGGRMVHVGSVDSPVAVGDVRQIAIEFQRAIGSGKNAPTLAGVDILGWDFALDTNETAQQTAAEAGLKVRFLRIPREVLEKKAVDEGDIKFFELAALSVDKSLNGRELSVWLTDFMIPPDDVPDDVAKAVRHWEDWIDYWAVDFNYRDDTFHNQRQTYRTRKDRTLLSRLNYTYSEPGDYVVLVKVIDILGNDTTKTLNVRVM
ncbi:MAG: DNA methyltransferase [Chloroflexi bacterium]|nr:DNA methyltransferase [Chloroflexota bacterium]